MKKILKWVLGITMGALIVALVFFVATGGASYMFALILESRWSKAEPSTKAQLESYLHYYKTREIQPSQSMWGSRYQMEPGERMTQYCILWDERCPLDVVYDEKDTIRAIFTSYE